MALGSKKPSGQDYRIARRKKADEEAEQHRQRLLADKKISAPEPCENVEFSHLWQLRRLVDYQYQVDTDPVMSLADKLKVTLAISAAMSKINLQADMERKVLDLQARDRERVRKFQALQDKLELERKMGAGK